MSVEERMMNKKKAERPFVFQDLVFKVAERGVASYKEIMEKWDLNDFCSFLEYAAREQE